MENTFLRAAELAGFFAAHAIWCVSEGETLVPLIGHERADLRAMSRFAAARLEDGVAQAKAWMTSNPDAISRAVLIYDGFYSAGSNRTDALICEVVEFGARRNSMQIVLPYRPATSATGFAVYRPKFIAATEVEDELAKIGQAFFRGINSHEKGSAIWTTYLDESA